MYDIISSITWVQIYILQSRRTSYQITCLTHDFTFREYAIQNVGFQICWQCSCPSSGLISILGLSVLLYRSCSEQQIRWSNEWMKQRRGVPSSRGFFGSHNHDFTSSSMGTARSWQGLKDISFKGSNCILCWYVGKPLPFYIGYS